MNAWKSNKNVGPSSLSLSLLRECFCIPWAKIVGLTRTWMQISLINLSQVAGPNAIYSHSFNPCFTKKEKKKDEQ